MHGSNVSERANLLLHFNSGSVLASPLTLSVKMSALDDVTALRSSRIAESRTSSLMTVCRAWLHLFRKKYRSLDV